MKYIGRKKIYFKTDFSLGADFSLDEVRKSKSATNMSGFDHTDGTLKKGYGISPSTFAESGCSGMWIYNNGNNTPMWSINGVVKYKDETQNTNVVAGISTVGNTYGINYKHKGDDTILIYSDGGKLYWWKGQDTPESSDLECINSLEVFDKRVFASVKGSSVLHYSTLNSPLAFGQSAGGGSMDLSDEKGEINKIIAFNDSLYVFKSYGIVKVNDLASGDYSVFNLYLGGGKIYSDTICKCGNVIMFMTDAGFCKFNGSSISYVMPEIFPAILPNEQASAAYHSGKYFLASKTKNGTILICYDFSSAVITQNIGITKLYPMGEVLCCLTNLMVGEVAKTGKYFNSNLPKKWQSAVMDFDTSRIKCIRSVMIKNTCKFTFTITIDGKSYEYDMGPDRQEINVNLRGKYVSFAISTANTDVYICPPVICYSVV